MTDSEGVLPLRSESDLGNPRPLRLTVEQRSGPRRRAPRLGVCRDGASGSGSRGNDSDRDKCRS